MGDALFASEESMYNFDLQSIYTSFLHSVEDDQGPMSGDVPYVVPDKGIPGASSCNDIAWTSAYPILTGQLGTFYGDRKAANQHWDSIVRYMDNLIRVAANSSQDLAVCDQFLDWVTAGVCETGMCPQFLSSKCHDSMRCPVGEMMGGFSYVQALKSVAAMARSLDRTPDAEKYQKAVIAATRGFHARFWNITSQSYGSDLSGIQMLTIPALSIEAMPTAAVRNRAVKLLGTDLYNRSGHHLQTGAVTSKSLLSMLSQYGMHKSALRVASQRTEPGWGWWLEQGATSCWEKWPGDTSRNHIFL